MSNDTALKPLPPADWEPSLGGISDDMGGRPLAVHGLMANHPDLLTAWWDLRNYTVTGGDLSQRQTELVILRVAWHMKNWYEWGSHVERALSAGLTVSEIDRVKRGPEVEGWARPERLLLAAVDELMVEKRLGPDLREALREHYSDRQLLDVIVTHGTYVILGCMLNTWPVELDEHIATSLPEDVKQESFESEFRPPEKKRAPPGAT
jgi:alkylhydroperoxidase family enzyme